MKTAPTYLVIVLALVAGATLARTALTSAVPGVASGGAELIARHRCGACHLDLTPPDATHPLTSSSARAVLELLRDPSRHPDFHLSEGEAVAIAIAVAPESARELARQRRQYRNATPELGTAMVRGLGCGACHTGFPREHVIAPVLSSVVAGSNPQWLRAYLSAPRAIRPFGMRPGSGARMPDFRLTAAEVDSIVEFLLSHAPRAIVRVEAGAALSAHGAATADALLDRLSCRGCHLYRGRGGRIGPELDHVRARRTAAYIASIIRDPAGTHTAAVMPRVQDARVERVVALLTSGDARGAAPAAAPSYLSPLEHALVPLRGDSRYATWCAACHGASGRGDGYNARFLSAAPAAHSDAAAMSLRPDDTLFDGVAAGGAALGRSAEMPPFGATLSTAEIAQMVAVIRELCSCTGPIWSRDGAR